MKAVTNLLGGLAGAVALNILHESVKRIDHNAPRVDLIGEEGLSKIIRAVGGQPPHGNMLYAATLASDLLSNAMYYSMIGAGKNKNLLWRGAGFGLAAGVGALKLTEPMGLDDTPITKTEKTKVMTVAWYLIGGIVTALTIRALRKR